MDICTVMYSFKINIEYICCAARYSRCILFDVTEFKIQWEKTGTQVPSACEQYEKVLWKERRKRKYFHSGNRSGKTPRKRSHWKMVGFCQTGKSEPMAIGEESAWLFMEGGTIPFVLSTGYLLQEIGGWRLKGSQIFIFSGIGEPLKMKDFFPLKKTTAFWGLY